MQKTCRQIGWKKGLRRVFAVAFLAFLLVEWGSHNLAFAHASSDDGRAVQAQDAGHEDPCKTMIRCSDGPGRNQPVLKLSHDVLQYSNFLDNLLSTPRWAELHKDPRLRRRPVHALFRPSDPLFHPPKVS